MPRTYVTTPIYYVNALPHIGHIYTTLVCDVLARYRRLRGDEVYFVTGTDEHGQKIEQAALERGLEPIGLADEVVARYHEHWTKLHVSHDDFIRTTEPRHTEGVEEMIRRIEASGDLYVDWHEGWYCSACETFYTEKELLEGSLCPDHGRPVERKAEENVFFRLSAYEDRLLEWYATGAVRPETRANEVRSFVESGLRDLSVSRAGLAWGIPFPGKERQTVYVWLDALTNYVSALGFGQSDDRLYRRFWEEGDARVHLIGKDILRFHAVYWPAFLMSAGMPLPTTVFAHGWWLRDGRKMSKSVGNVVRPDHLVESFGADPLRFFLLRETSFGQDASFSDEGFIERYNGDLANGLGNTVSRLLTMSRKQFGGRTPPSVGTGSPLEAATARAVEAYLEAMDDLAFHRALDSLWGVLAETNQYLTENEPWKLAKQEGAEDRMAEILGSSLEAVRVVATALLPVMPETAARVLEALGCRPVAAMEELAWGRLPVGVEVPPGEPLFPRIDKEEFFAAEAKTNQDDQPVEGEGADMVSFDQFMNVELRVATITAAEEIPKSNKLLKVSVDLGDEQRTVVAGIKKQYTPEELVGKQVVVVANLEPAQLMGVESQGMILAAEVEGAPMIVSPEAAVPNGSRVR